MGRKCDDYFFVLFSMKNETVCLHEVKGDLGYHQSRSIIF